jgi:hypothetical protein
LQPAGRGDIVDLMKDLFIWFLVAALGAFVYFLADFRFFRFAYHPPWEYEAVGILATILVAADAFPVWRNKKRRRPNGDWN